MRFGMLFSEQILRGFGEEIGAAARAAGVEPLFVPLPREPGARLDG